MNKAEEIRKRLKELTKAPVQTLLGIVANVDENGMTCSLMDNDDDFEYPGIRLRPVLDGLEGLTLFPKDGTWGLAIRIEDDEEWMLIAAGEIDKWRLSIGTTIIEQDGDGLLIKKDDDTLKEALTLIIQAVQKIVVLQGTNPDQLKLTQALDKVNNLLR